jgi:hypothetical protein
MIFHIPTKGQKLEIEKEEFSKWHKKFAWLPVRMDSDISKIVWLEFVLRKGKIDRWSSGDLHWKWSYVESTFDILKNPDL